MTVIGADFCEEYVRLEAGSNEATSSLLNQQSRWVLSKVNDSCGSTKIVIVSCSIVFPRKFVELFCSKYESDLALSNKILADRPPDFTITVGEASFPIHKDILSYSSGYFEGMFSGSYSESAHNELELDDFDFKPKTIKQLIEFAYGGKLDDYSLELYGASNYFLVDKLIEQSRQSIISNLSPEVAILALIAGHKHSDFQLKSRAIMYVIEFLIDVQKEHLWTDCLFKNYPAIVNDIFTEMKGMIKKT
jgi:hypothetical protein